MLNQQEQHDLILEKTHDSGAEEWSCPTCGRKMLVQWDPSFKRIVLEKGNDMAIHNGSKGNINIGQPAISQPEEPQIMSDELCSLLDDALKDVDFGD